MLLVPTNKFYLNAAPPNLGHVITFIMWLVIRVCTTIFSLKPHIMQFLLVFVFVASEKNHLPLLTLLHWKAGGGFYYSRWSLSSPVVIDWRSMISPRGGTPACQWRGWSKDFFGFEIFDSGIFLDKKIWQVFFWVTWFKYGIFLGIKNKLKWFGTALAYLWYNE